jgi:hypothetical protein
VAEDFNKGDAAMYRVMRRAIACLVAFLALAPNAQAGLIWYNGDPDLVNGLANEINTQVSHSRIYDDFVISSNVKLTGLFSNNFMDFATTQAAWEIRSGVSVGNGGTVVASGVGTATQTVNGFNAFGYTGYTIEVGSLSVDLFPGTYWLNVAPVGSGPPVRSFLQTTSGANAVGTPAGDNLNAFWDSTVFGHAFARTSDVDPAFAYDFSMGVYAQDTSAIPEPSSLALMVAFGTCAIAFRCARGRRKRGS